MKDYVIWNRGNIGWNEYISNFYAKYLETIFFLRQTSMETIWVGIIRNQLIFFGPLNINFPNTAKGMFTILSFMNGDIPILQVLFQKLNWLVTQE